MVTICTHALSVERKSGQKNGEEQFGQVWSFFLLRGRGNFNSYIYSPQNVGNRGNIWITNLNEYNFILFNSKFICNGSEKYLKKKHCNKVLKME